MSPLEITANLLNLASVLLTIYLRKTLYPVGMAATALFLFVFWKAHLYASAGLQVYFTLIQIYGWWFWTRGDRGKEPRIGDWSWSAVFGLGMGTVVLTGLVAWILYRFTQAQAPLLDTAILTLSVLAQFLLDRKQIKNWIVWGAVDALSIYVYGGQGLWLTAGMYAVFLAMVVYGWLVWRRAQNSPALAIP